MNDCLQRGELELDLRRKALLEKLGQRDAPLISVFDKVESSCTRSDEADARFVADIFRGGSMSGTQFVGARTGLRADRYERIESMLSGSAPSFPQVGDASRALGERERATRAGGQNDADWRRLVDASVAAAKACRTVEAKLIAQAAKLTDDTSLEPCSKRIGRSSSKPRFRPETDHEKLLASGRDMPLLCPRDRTELTLEHSLDGKLEIDRCRTCSGIWLDANELAALCPTASHLPERREEVFFALEQHPCSPFACLRCAGRGLDGPGRYTATSPAEAVRQITLVDLVVDFCLACGGVWLDGDELWDLFRDRPTPGKKAPASPFRMSAAEVGATGSTVCHVCRARVAKGALYASSGGYMCLRCYSAWPEQPSKIVVDPLKGPVQRLAATVGEALGLLAALPSDRR